MLAYDYPLLGIFWTTLWIFVWIAWFMLLFRVIFDIFRSHDMGGGGKALWCIFVIFLPFLGVFVYLIARGHDMGKRDFAEAQAQNEAFKSYVQEAAGSSGGASAADELTKLAQLHQQGMLTDDEFAAQKAKLLA